MGGHAGEEVEDAGPDDDEEEDDEDDDTPSGKVLRGPEVEPVATVRGGEPVVLDDDDNEEPQYNLSSEEGGVERRYVAGGLAVVFWEANEEDCANSPHQECDYHTNRNDCGFGGNGSTTACGDVLGVFCQFGAPVPERHNVDLLRALDDTGAVDPGRDGCTTWKRVSIHRTMLRA